MSALVDGQLDAESNERAWAHVLHCPPCRRDVEREGWVKRRLTETKVNDGFSPPEALLGSLYGLEPHGSADQAWIAVGQIEHQGRFRRRAGIALVGAGSVSAAVLGLTTFGGALLGSPAGAPAASLTRPPSSSQSSRANLSPATVVHGRLPGWTVTRRDDGATRAVSAATRR